MSDTEDLIDREDRGKLTGITMYLDSDVEDAIKRVNRLLAGISGGAEKAISAAAKRASSSTVSYSARAINKEYLIKSADFKHYTEMRNNITSFPGGTQLSIKYRGHRVPLIRFDYRIGTDGILSARVKRSSTRTAFRNAFVATMPNKHVGIYERTGKLRTEDEIEEGKLKEEIKQFWGPSVPQMVKANDEVKHDIAKHFSHEFKKRTEVEINRLLTGLGGKR